MANVTQSDGHCELPPTVRNALEDVLDYLKPKLERNAMKPVIIRPLEGSAYGDMVDVFDELRQADEKKGFEVKNISIPTQREIDAFWY